MNKSYLIQIVLKDYLTKTPTPINEVKFLQEFNDLTTKERFELLTADDGFVAEDILQMVKFAIKNAGGIHTYADGKSIPEQITGETEGISYQVIYDRLVNRFYLQFKKKDGTFYEDEFIFQDRVVHPAAIEAAKNVVLFLVGAKRREEK